MLMFAGFSCEPPIPKKKPPARGGFSFGAGGGSSNEDWPPGGVQLRKLRKGDRKREGRFAVCWVLVRTANTKEKTTRKGWFSFGAGGGTRTHTVSLPTDFESHQAIGISKYLLEINRVLCTDKYDEIGLFLVLREKIGQKNGITFFVHLTEMLEKSGRLWRNVCHWLILCYDR
ncbi:MAG: hypothetical protein IJ412_00180 [Oscillospiraceae bacterium]|nr:hypothetical protein [Oscillospiraceae bacterium]